MPRPVSRPLAQSQTEIAAASCWLAGRLGLVRRVRLALLGARLIVVVLLGAFTPLIIQIGRSLDFVPRVPPPPQLANFQLLHLVYTGSELLELGCVGLVAFWLMRRRSEAEPSPEPLRA